MNLSAMAPNHHFMLNGLPMEPVSRTYQYRKIMKPMLERKRRARINKCLDELKDLMTGTLQADGENVSKLEKADILELTVRHLHRLREHNSLFLQANMIGGNTNNNNNVLNTEKFWAGFQHCAAEVLQFLSRYDRTISGELIQHIASYIPGLPVAAPQSTVTAPPTLSPPPPPPPPTTATATTMKTATLHQRELATAMRPHLPARPADSAKVRIHPYARQRVENEEHVWRPW